MDNIWDKFDGHGQTLSLHFYIYGALGKEAFYWNLARMSRSCNFCYFCIIPSKYP